MTKFIFAAALAATLAIATPTVFAQTNTAPAPQHQSILHKLFGKKQPAPMAHPGMTGTMGRPMAPMHGGMTGYHVGSIIGNKNTHVYHLPGDTSSLPAPKNRVYFTTELQAMAAGYHKSGMTHSSTMTHKMHNAPHGTMAPMHH